MSTESSVEDPRFEPALAQLREKAAKWHRATKFGELVLREFAQTLREHLGYPVFSCTRPVKKWGRICQKVARNLLEDTECSPDDAAERITDIAGGRVLVVGLDDLATAELQFKEFINIKYGLEAWDFERFIETCRPGGFRGLAGGMHIRADELQRFPFELQLMTPLQDTWDKLQHPVYERIRTHGAEGQPSDVDEWFEDLSERFYDLDKEITQKQQNFRSRGFL